MKKIEYDTATYNFKQLLQDKFALIELENIESDLDLFTRENDQNTDFHKKYYELARTDEFQTLYLRFLQDVVQPLYSDKIIYQVIPTFRICFPNNIAVGEFHKDKSYRDEKWAEEVKEDNFFLPITDAFGTNTVWVESEEDKGDYSPMDCKYGEVIQWDGSNLKHGNKKNTTGKTRISVDFRVIQKKNYKDSNHGSINTNTQFKIGGYYEELEYKLSNLSYKDNNLELKKIIDVIRINEGTTKDFTLSLVSGQDISCGNESESMITKNWSYLKNRAKSYGKTLFNRESLQIEEIDIIKNNIVVSKNVDYKNVVSIRSNNKTFSEHKCSPCPNAFVVVSILITRDDKIVLGKRNFYGDWSNDTYEMSGAFSNYDDLTVNSLIQIAQNKIKEDYDIEEASFQTIPYGIYHFPRILETIFLCITKIDKNSEELRSSKYSDVLIVDNNHEGLKKIITMPVSKFHPPSRTVLQFFYENYSKAVTLFSKLDI